MPVISLNTEIHAPIEICFDLSRSIDLHKISVRKSREEAIAGTTSGLIKLNETVTWRANHFGMWFKMTSKITAFKSPEMFVDEMVTGPFKKFHHTHFFIREEGRTLMTDTIIFESPAGILGKLFNFFVLTSYLKKLIKKRNNVIQYYAESDMWQTVLKD